MGLGRHDEALRHLTRSAELELRAGARFDAFCTYSNAAQLSLDLGRIEDCVALLDSLLVEPDVVDGELDDRLVAQLRLTRARALRAGDDLKAATAEFVALAAESAGWDDDPGSHAMIAAETAVLLGEAGEFAKAREAVDQALVAHARDPRYELVSNALRELARLQAQQQGPEGLTGARVFLDDAGRVADAARAVGFEAHGRSWTRPWPTSTGGSTRTPVRTTRRWPRWRRPSGCSGSRVRTPTWPVSGRSASAWPVSWRASTWSAPPRPSPGSRRRRTA